MSTSALFAGIKGAPPASDTEAWALAGSSPATTGPSAPAGPGVIAADLTPEQRHGLKVAIAAGTPEAYSAWERSLSPQGAAAPPEAAGEVVPPADPYDADFDPETLARFAEFGAHPMEVSELEPHYDKFRQSLAVLPDDAARHAAVLAAEERTLHRIYRGSEAAMKQGVADLTEAARLLNLDLEAINQSGALADPAVHHRALLAARRILQNRKA